MAVESEQEKKKRNKEILWTSRQATWKYDGEILVLAAHQIILSWRYINCQGATF